eukprot:2659971-Pleurochrysis_carterae.AAC.3
MCYRNLALASCALPCRQQQRVVAGPPAAHLQTHDGARTRSACILRKRPALPYAPSTARTAEHRYFLGGPFDSQAES